MPLTVPPPWRLGTPATPAEALLRFKLAWVRDVVTEAPSIIGVIMYNGSSEGVDLGPRERFGLVNGYPVSAGSRLVSDGPTHRRVRKLLSAYTEIRVANLSPFRGAKPADAVRWEGSVAEVPGYLEQGQLALDLAGRTLDDARREALAWACSAPTVVVAWGAGRLPPAMAAARQHVLDLARGRMFCWGQTPAGCPYHPSPLNPNVTPATSLRPWSPS